MRVKLLASLSHGRDSRKSYSGDGGEWGGGRWIGVGGQRLEPAGEKGSVAVSGPCRGKGNSEGMQAESMSGAAEMIKSTLNRTKTELLREARSRDAGARGLGPRRATAPSASASLEDGSL